MYGVDSEKRSRLCMIFLGAITGLSLQLHGFIAEETMVDVSRVMLFLRIFVAAHIGALLFWGVWQIIRWMVQNSGLSQSCKTRHQKYDVWPFAVFLLTLSGYWGIQLIFPFMAILMGVFVLGQVLLLVGAQIVEQRLAFFHSFGWLLFLFLLSGGAALIYQVVWQRTLFAVFGVNIESVTVIVSVFMFGLGVGALVGGQLSEKFVGRLPYLFMICELMIGLFGVGSLWLIESVGAATQGFGLLAVFLTTFVLLCVPTILMGATLPILVTFLFAHFQQIGRTVGLLYFANTLGSAIACFLTVDVLFAFFGQQAVVWIAAGFNLGVGALVLVFARGIASNVVAGDVP